MAECSKRTLGILLGLLLLLLLLIGIGVGVFMMIGAEEACEEKTQEDREKIFEEMKQKGWESLSSNISTRRQDKLFHEALGVLERLTCTEQKKTWAWTKAFGGSFAKDLPGYVGEQCCAIPHPAEMPDISWIKTIADRALDTKCSADAPSQVDDDLCHGALGALRAPDIQSWKTDDNFEKSFYQGINPLVVRLVQSMDEIKEEFRNITYIEEENVSNVSSLLENKRLFVANYSSLESIPLANGSEKVFYAPQVLFVRTIGGDLNFLGIHLFSRYAPPNKNNQLITRYTDDNRKLFAWMHVALADAQIHEVSHHLAIHFVMEAVAVARHNSLDGHIIGRLLEPHMTGTIFINFAARHDLVKPKNSQVEKMFSVGRDGALRMISELMSKPNFWEGMIFPRMMEKRGFPENKSDKLENYFYRDDGFKLWNALHKYTSGVVDITYDTDEDVRNDENLKEFFASLADKEKGNLPGFPKKPENKKILAETLTAIIFTGSVQHQALNSPQFTYSYQPHRPVLLKKWMPDEGSQEDNELSLEWIKNATAISSPENMQAIYLLTNVISTPMQSQCNLLGLKVFEHDGGNLAEVGRKLHSDLQDLSSEVSKRTGTAGPLGVYNFLDPARVACSIDI